MLGFCPSAMFAKASEVCPFSLNDIPSGAPYVRTDCNRTRLRSSDHLYTVKWELSSFANAMNVSL